MPSFGRPQPDFNYNLDKELTAVNSMFKERGVPKKENKKLLIASFNVANLGEQKRTDKDLKLIAGILNRFDLIAIQEVKDDYKPMAKIVEYMGKEYDFIISDTAGNNERLGFIYDSKKVSLGKLFAEFAIPARKFPKKHIYVPYSYYKEQRVDVFYDYEFQPFDRNPFIGTFKAGSIDFMLVNVHLYYGAAGNSNKVENRAKFARRVMEIYTLSKWLKDRLKDGDVYDKDIMLLGDMNVPKMETTNPAYKALKYSGLRPTPFYSKTGGSTIADNGMTYDQISITKGDLEDRLIGYNVIDFDNFIFSGLWDKINKENLSDTKKASKFNKYLKAYISDHRPLWIQLDIS